MKLNYNEVLDYQEYWKESGFFSKKQQDGLIELSNKLVQRVKENNDELDGVKLLYPEDCSDFDIFTGFACAMQAYVIPRKENGFFIDGWTLNREIEVK